MLHGRESSLSSLTGSFNDSFSVSSVGSPRTSPIYSPLESPNDSPRDSLNQQFSQSISLQPPPPNSKTNNNNTFVHKLYNMVIDNQYQHLIAWNYTGSSFIVCNIMEFSRDVLPKHFKHNNFSSFVRQLNMYGFHKVNKSPRGHRTLAENQIWEFSHPKFLKDRSHLLDDIKRKSLETDVTKKDNNDMSSHMTMIQASQTELMQKLNRLQESFTHIVKDLEETKTRQNKQQELLKHTMDFLIQRHGVQLHVPPELNMNYTDLISSDNSCHDNDRNNDNLHIHSDINNNSNSNNSNNNNNNHLYNETPPSIFITSHDNTTLPQHNTFCLDPSSPSFTSPTRLSPNITPISNQSGRNQHLPALTVQTQNLSQHRLNVTTSLSPLDQQTSPALSAYHTALNTPISCSPSPFVSDDDIPSIYSPITPNGLSLQHNNNNNSSNGSNGSNGSNNGHPNSFNPTFYTGQSIQPQQMIQQNNDLLMMDSPSIAAYNAYAIIGNQRIR